MGRGARGEWIRTIGSKVAELGWAAPFVYVVLYVIGTVVLAPSPLMSIAAGVAFGWWGFPLRCSPPPLVQPSPS
jgi:uncharacterized membrane protein YdjX (TVP38/TMEM64 family)